MERQMDGEAGLGAALPGGLRGWNSGKSQTPGFRLPLSKGHGLNHCFTNFILEQSSFSQRKPYTESCFISKVDVSIGAVLVERDQARAATSSAPCPPGPPGARTCGPVA